MRIVRLITLLCGLLWMPLNLWAAPPVLARLEYESGILFPDQAIIYDEPGIKASRYAGKPRTLWVLRPGDSLRAPFPPAERTIRFYRANGNDTETVCTVLIKYVADGSNWRPTYHLLQMPMVAFDGKRLVPVGSEDSARGLMQLHGLQTPDREGFYRELVFGYASEPTIIDAWEVQ